MGISLREVWEKMAETNNDAVLAQEPKKKKETVKKVKEDKPAKDTVKKLPVKKDAAPPPKGETVGKIRKFLRGAWAELKKVSWPNRQQIIAYTGVVLVSVVFVGALIWIADSILSKILKFIIK